jgi:threonine dehydrogenase-like Zn-dependent dehydrogenase
VGAWYYHFGEFPQMLDLFRSGVPIDRLITHRFPLERVDEGYRAMALGQSGKVVLEY